MTQQGVCLHLQGLKQRLLVYLFRQALDQCRPIEPRPRGIKEDGQSRPGSRGSSGSASAIGNLRASVGGAPGMSVPPTAAAGLVDRRPLERFFYHFEAFLELVMWKV